MQSFTNKCSISVEWKKIVSDSQLYKYPKVWFTVLKQLYFQRCYCIKYPKRMVLEDCLIKGLQREVRPSRREWVMPIIADTIVSINYVPDAFHEVFTILNKFPWGKYNYHRFSYKKMKLEKLANMLRVMQLEVVVTGFGSNSCCPSTGFGFLQSRELLGINERNNREERSRERNI